LTYATSCRTSGSHSLNARLAIANLATISETYMGSSADLIEDTFSSYPLER
jgi:hypothetical protein